MKEKILTLIIGVLIGAILATGGFLIYNKSNSKNRIHDRGDKIQMMQNGNGKNMGTPPDMKSGNQNNQGTPPEKPSDDNQNNQSAPQDTQSSNS